MSEQEYVTFYPGPGEETEMAQALLALVDEPGQLATTGDTASSTGYVAFVVPAAIGERYLKDKDEDAPKRRGRPRKAATDTTEGDEGE
jgi:hypothetical protein